MKWSIAFSLLTLIFCDAVAQQAKGECPFLKSVNFDVFIEGYSDTIQANGLKARSISVVSLTNGFELSTNDSLAKVISFRLIFDDTATGNLYSKSALGNKITDNEKHMFSLSRLKTSSLITLDQIIVEYKGTCFTLPGQVYYPR